MNEMRDCHARLGGDASEDYLGINRILTVAQKVIGDNVHHDELVINLLPWVYLTLNPRQTSKYKTARSRTVSCRWSLAKEIFREDQSNEVLFFESQTTKHTWSDKLDAENGFELHFRITISL